MTADTLIAEVTALGVQLSVNGGKLRIEAPCGAITPSLRARLAEAKAEILAVLRRQAAPGACGACHGMNWWYSVHGAVVCWTCHPPADLDLVSWWTL